ncbi:CPBP family intramembrane glutamic endopeptidase [Streptococcus dentiloxodontae]
MPFKPTTFKKLLSHPISLSLLFILFLVISSLISTGLSNLLLNILGISQQNTANPVLDLILQGIAYASNALPLLLWVRYVEKRSIFSLGLSIKTSKWKTLIQGWLISLVLCCLIVAVFLVTGAVRLKAVHLSVFSLPLLLFAFVVRHLQAGSEELLTRGWYFPSLSKSLGKWAGLLISSLVFGLLHVASGYVDGVFILNVILFAIFLCLYTWEKGNIWGAIAIHGFNNFLFSAIFAFDTPAYKAPSYAIFILENHSKHLLDNGFFGSSIACVLYETMVLILIGKRLFRNKKEGNKN